MGNLLCCNTTLSGNSGVVFGKVRAGVILWKQASGTPPPPPSHVSRSL
jgi:hypothetical protein